MHKNFDQLRSNSNNELVFTCVDAHRGLDANCSCLYESFKVAKFGWATKCLLGSTQEASKGGGVRIMLELLTWWWNWELCVTSQGNNRQGLSPWESNEDNELSSATTLVSSIWKLTLIAARGCWWVVCPTSSFLFIYLFFPLNTFLMRFRLFRLMRPTDAGGNK